jgi:hypothetical protein
MWRRLRRRSMAPRRPLMYPDQLGLVVITLVAIAGGVYIVVRALIG